MRIEVAKTKTNRKIYQNNHILVVPLKLTQELFWKRKQLCLTGDSHWRLPLDHHPKAHLHRIDASCHTFFSTAEPFA